MKKSHLLLLIVITVLFSSCSKYGYVQLSFPVEPQAYLPEGINEIAVVNRSITSEEAKDKKVLEAIVTGELAGSDRLSSSECIKGVFAASQEWPYTNIIIPETVNLEGTGTRDVPKLLDWDLVAEICEKENADALLVLETFDSNTNLLKEAALDQVFAVIATGAPVAKVPDNMKVNVASYWRLYDPDSKSIIDQYQHNTYMNFNLVGGIPPIDALPRSAYAAGQSYFNRFMPSYYNVKRTLYKRAKGPMKHQFRAGYRRAEVANWEGAIELWNELPETERRKTAGRACLNVAVAYEVLGDNNMALKWAQRSYERFGDKLGRDYSKILLRRQRIEGR